MEFEFIERSNTKIAKIVGKEIVVQSLQDATDLIGNADYQGARKVILDEKNLNPEFFNLKTGFAGEVLQKYANYHMKLAIVGEFEKYNSNALNAFILECNRGDHIYFVSDLDSAIEKLS